LRIAFIDHYDSFSDNVIDWLLSASDVLAIERFFADDPQLIPAVKSLQIPTVFSPGPKSPVDLENSVILARELMGHVPLLGICLGHQIFAHSTGVRIVRSAHPFHGSTRSICIENATFTSFGNIYSGSPMIFEAGTYNSLVVDPDSIGDRGTIAARCECCREVQACVWHCTETGSGVSHSWPAWSVQYHPESFLSKSSEYLLKAWMEVACAFESRIS